MDYGATLQLAGTALEAGAERKTLGHVLWNVAGNCTAPRDVEVHARPDAWAFPVCPQGLSADWWKAFKDAGLIQKELRARGFAYDGRFSAHALWITITVRCRRCAECLKQRAAKWRTAAMTELERSSRSWFCTFTLNPHEQFMLTCKSAIAEQKRSVDFHTLEGPDAFRSRVRTFGPDIGRFFKRVRKNSGAKIRYLWVAEAHKTGLPHFHALLHECDPARPLRKAVIKDAWGYGFSDVKLVNDQAPAWYVCKYLTKYASARVRASLHYGR